MLLVILPKVRGVYFFPKIIFFPRPTFENHIFFPDHNLRFLPYLNPICINIHIKNFLIISKNIFYLKLLIFPLEILIIKVFFCLFLHFPFIFIKNSERVSLLQNLASTNPKASYRCNWYSLRCTS